MRRIMFDIEANGLLDVATVVHCLVAKDIDTGEVFKFHPDEDECYIGLDPIPMLSFLEGCSLLIAHNGIAFDMPLLDKLYGWVPNDSTTVVWDTLVMSRLLHPDRAPVAGTRAPHGVEAWGKRFGRWKPDHSNWFCYTHAMLHRCSEDVEIQFMILQHLMKEAEMKDGLLDIFDKKSYAGPCNWADAMYHEHMSATIMKEQEDNGCDFNSQRAEEYVSTLTSIIETSSAGVLQFTNSKPSAKGVEVKRPFKNNGDLSKAVLDWYLDDDESLHSVGGPFTRVDWNELNLGSEKQLKEWLYTIGWEPDAWNFSKTEVDGDGNPVRTSPKLTDTSLSKLPHGIGDMLIKRSKSRHRRSQIQGWIDNTREDGRIEAQANPIGTPTCRMRHRIVANVPKPNVYENKEDKDDPRNGTLIWYPEESDVFFGTEMRSLFQAKEGRVLVGRDASGLELRCFAHYLNDPEYTEILLKDDIHIHNQKMAGLPTRGNAKTFIYAFLYGAGAKRLGDIVLPDGTDAQKTAAGQEMKERFLAANPKLDALIKEVRKASDRGWLRGLDGRKLHMRTQYGRIQRSKALNTLLQGAGAIIMTRARVSLWKEIQEKGWEYQARKVLDYHDEETYEVIPKLSEELRVTMIESVVNAGLYYNLNLPLDADARIGKTWAEIH